MRLEKPYSCPPRNYHRIPKSLDESLVNELNISLKKGSRHFSLLFSFDYDTVTVVVKNHYKMTKRNIDPKVLRCVTFIMTWKR